MTLLTYLVVFNKTLAGSVIQKLTHYRHYPHHHRHYHHPHHYFYKRRRRRLRLNRGILVFNICLISISNSVSDGATNKSVLNTERS